MGVKIVLSKKSVSFIFISILFLFCIPFILATNTQTNDSLVQHITKELNTRGEITITAIENTELIYVFNSHTQSISFNNITAKNLSIVVLPGKQLFKVAKGENLIIDFDKDGVDDLFISIDEITNQKQVTCTIAMLNSLIEFKKKSINRTQDLLNTTTKPNLGLLLAPELLKNKTQEILNTTTETKTANMQNMMWILTILLVMIAAVIGFYLGKRNKHEILLREKKKKLLDINSNNILDDISLELKPVTNKSKIKKQEKEINPNRRYMPPEQNTEEIVQKIVKTNSSKEASTVEIALQKQLNKVSDELEELISENKRAKKELTKLKKTQTKRITTKQPKAKKKNVPKRTITKKRTRKTRGSKTTSASKQKNSVKKTKKIVRKKTTTKPKKIRQKKSSMKRKTTKGQTIKKATKKTNKKKATKKKLLKRKPAKKRTTTKPKKTQTKRITTKQPKAKKKNVPKRTITKKRTRKTRGSKTTSASKQKNSVKKTKKKRITRKNSINKNVTTKKHY